MSGKRTARISGAFVVMLVMMAAPALSQVTTGSVAGTVKDAQGGVIPGATVILAWLILKEHIGPIQKLGILAALAAIVLMTI